MARSGGLASLLQADFSGGMWQGTQRALVPDNAAYDMVNLLLNDDGSAYRRGGTKALWNAAFGSALKPLLWDGVLTPGQRTLAASGSAFATAAADGVTPVSLGGAGVSAPARASELNGFVFVDGGAIYAGSQKTADASAGTVAVTNGSPTVTGTGSSWATNADAGMLLRVAGAGRYYIVKSVNSATSITLTENYEGSTASGQSYALTRLGTTSVSPYRGNTFAVVANRLISFETNQIWESDVLKPSSFPANNFLQVPGGVTILGGERVADTLLVFTTDGIWGAFNMALEITDQAGNPQQRLQQLNGDVILWGKAGIAGFSGGLVVPALDHVYLVSGTGSAVPITESIKALYQTYVRNGYVPGPAAVFLSHYLLPILDSSNVVQDVLVCRLDRPQQSREGVAYPWTHMADTGGKVCAFAVRGSARPPKLLGSSSLADQKVVQADTWWAPDATVKNDHDGATHHVDLITRDFQPGGLQTWKRAQVRYEATDAATDAPQLLGYYSLGVKLSGGATWGTATWGVDSWVDSSLAEFVQFATSAPVSDGRNPWGWTFAGRGRFIRVRFQSSAPYASLVIRDLRLSFRQSPKG